MSWNHDGCEDKVLWYTCPFRMEGEGHKELETIKREMDNSHTSKQLTHKKIKHVLREISI